MVLLIVIVLFMLLPSSTEAKSQYSSYNDGQQTSSSNPYRILGVSSSASLEEIKHQYRTLAKEHHPDKGGNPETFAEIANAYQMLSDPEERRRFDQQQFRGKGQQQPKAQSQKQQDAQRRAQQFQRQKQQTHQKETKQRQIERAKYARLMQRHLLRIHTMEDLFEHDILNDEMTFRKNFVGVFVGNKKEEKLVDNDFFFPFPFWGEGRNGMVWQDVLQTAKIRYNKATELTTLFGTPHGKTHMPHIVFVRAGQSIQDIKVFSPRGLSELQEQLEVWVISQLVAPMTIVNRHHSAVKLFLVSDQTQSGQQRQVLIQTVDPGQAISLVLRLGDKIVAVDVRVDAYPGSPSFDASFFKGYPQEFIKSSPNPESWYFQNPAILGEYLIGLDTTLTIEEEYCLDLSLKCQAWTVQLNGKKTSQHSICQQQPAFMHHICPATCGICHRKKNWWFEKLQYLFRHAPIYEWPHWIRPVVVFARYALQDMTHVLGSRQTIASVFLAIGATLGANVFFIPTWLLGDGVASIASAALMFTWRDICTLGVFGSTLLFWVWVQFGTSASNSSFRRDWDHVLEWQVDALFGLIGWGIVVAVLLKEVAATFWRRADSSSLRNRLGYSSLVLVIFAGLSTSLMMVAIFWDSKNSRESRWRHIWRLRRNVAAALTFTGIIIGKSIPSLWKALRRCPEFIFLVIVNAVVLLGLDWLSLNDGQFIQDLDHVLQLRMSGAIPIAIFGIFIGFGVPFGVTELMTMQPTAINRPESTKAKSE